MKKKVIIVITLLVLLALLVPVPMHLKDGGTVEYRSLTYKISKVHKLNNASKAGYEDGIIIEILGIKIYDNVIIEDIPNTNEENKEKEVTWEEITADGVNEELLLMNVDDKLLTEIATELQTLVSDAKQEEIENPEIVITEGWARVWEYERYKKVLNMGSPAMKPLYLIIYKSPNAGEYEYLCARILYELSGFDFYWTNSKDFLECFNQKIIESRQ